MKLGGIILILFLSGCSSIETVSGGNLLKDAIEQPQPIQKSEVVADNKYYTSNHNWNNIEPIKESPAVKERVRVNNQKEDLPFPWPLIIIACVSGGMYFINKIKLYRDSKL